MTRTSSLGEAEDLHHIFLAVLGSLGLVVDRELAVALVDHGRGVRSDRVVVLDGDPVLVLRSGSRLCRTRLAGRRAGAAAH